MSLSDLCSTLTESLSTALSSLPDDASLAPPPDGISLLDTKNQLLLSYLHNLVFFVILKLRNLEPQSDAASIEPTSDETVLKTLVSLRVYLERGVRPLESRLKYQLDKLLLATNNAESQSQNNFLRNGATSQKITDPARPEPYGSSASSSPNPSSPPPTTSRMADLSHRPNPSAFIRPTVRATSPNSRNTSVYRPPQINPALPPTSAKPQRKPRPSHTLNEYVREELNDSPIVQPSIGTGSGLRGKAAEREVERRNYEEGRLVRLPGEGKKAKRRRDVGEGFGEDLILGGAGELDNLVKGGKKKRRVEGGERKIGEAWEKRVKRGLGKKRR
ncbi:MAG: hypothetical protein HETSPECPRED_004862 [Heterodermia speciosa]|uniref:Uncharacterized protein n=1 Tax=Heterodermia speciosa TaxID=116794 RepID=A0A8H3EGZ4_9LECA|nr:MAG: hypothetical protein HETSPECPRED_004862 [Heterodermia speciosa]